MYGFETNKVLAVSNPGNQYPLFSIAELMGKNSINILHGYSSTIRTRADDSVFIINTGNNDKAKTILENNGFLDLDETSVF